MKFRIWLVSLFFLMLAAQLSAMGQQEEVETQIQKEEWILCITEFDTSSLSENRLIVSEVIKRNLVESLSSINYRTRISPEYAFYEKTAWARERSNAARALAAKQNERSLFLFRGDPNWRYRRNLERVDAEIKVLRALLEEAEENMPLVDGEPLFNLTADNLELKFPPPPRAGREFRFCQEHNSDAILTGSISSFHERFIVSWRLYTIYTQSFVWEDSIIFSHNDIESAMEEISRRLNVVVSANEPSVLTVRTQPEETLVLINRTFAGRGEIADMELPPGTIVVDASAPYHQSLTFEAELFPGEFTDIEIGLRAIEYGNVEIAGPAEARVYHGSLFVGEAPLTLRLPLNQMEFIEVETLYNEIGSIVFLTPGEPEFNYSLFLPVSIPLPAGSVDRARRMFYWAWGGTWITGIAAWLTYQSYMSSNSAISINYMQTGTFNQRFYDDVHRMYYISMGTVVALGVVAVLDVFLISRYIQTANRSSPSIGTSR